LATAKEALERMQQQRLVEENVSMQEANLFDKAALATKLDGLVKKFKSDS
jgi:hypothetical protein